MIPQEIIRRKRNGAELSEEELRAFMGAYLREEVTDYHMAAFLMAVYFRGMGFEETVRLCRIYLESGTRIDLGSVPGIPVDKHSTGGVGDKTSLLLVPMLAAVGVPAPMISGRALGHTGGTLDKLDSIPGFRTQLSEREYVDLVRDTGMAMAGQTASLVPLDKRLYALRDVTSTVEVLPLIGASIMSKKIAGGARALVLDVKTGHGAFMEDEEDARTLALLLCRIGEAFDLPTSGFLTDMNSPLGRTIGNWLEVKETIAVLHGENIPDLVDVTLALSAAMMRAGGVVSSLEEGVRRSRDVLRSGAAFTKFVELVRSQGGDASVIEEPSRMPAAAYQRVVTAERAGIVAELHARTLALVALELGVGRLRTTDPVDPLAGIEIHAHLGDRVDSGDPLCTLHTSRRPIDDRLAESARAAWTWTDTPPPIPGKVRARFDSSGFSPWIPLQP